MKIRRRLPDPLPGLFIVRLTLTPQSAMTGVPHTAGTREYLFCEHGTVVLTASGTRYEVAAGEALVLRGDQKHGYARGGQETAVAFSVVALAAG